MRVKTTIQWLDPDSFLKVVLYLVLSLLFAWLCYQLAHWMVGLGINDFMSRLSQDTNSHKLALVDYGALVFYGLCGSLLGIAGMCIELLLNQSSTPGGQYVGLNLLLIVPLLLLLSLPFAMILVVLSLFGGNYAPTWFCNVVLKVI